MTDIDSYLLKCALEELGTGKSHDQITQECACKYGYITPEISQQLNNKMEKKNDN